MKTTAVIPTRNEERTIAEVIRATMPHVDELIVISAKNSNDRTLAIAEDLGARTFIDSGKGKGEALRIGIQEATGDVIVFLDADGSHIADDIPKVLQPIIAGDADMVIASRMTGGSEELHGDVPKFIRLFLSAIITLIINYRFNVRITDSQNGFRAIKTAVARELNLKANSFDIETEMLMKCLKKGYRVAEVPSRELERRYGESGINVLIMGWRYIWRVLVNLL
jgi:dolichol-phosphate mannosyltransferase